MSASGHKFYVIERQIYEFIETYCIIDKDNKCLALDILGAYRMWNKKMNPQSITNLTTYMKNNYKLRQDYSAEHNTKFTYYMGIQPKEFIIKQENKKTLPHYEEFVLSECKFSYTNRTTKTILYDEFKRWVFKKYPEYIFTKNEQIHMESYLNRTFLNSKKLHLQGDVNGYYGLQMKNNPSEYLTKVAKSTILCPNN